MENLASALQQILISRILNERLLEAILGIRRQALYQQNVCLGEPVERGLQRRVLHPGHGAKEWVGEVPSNHGADLCHLARRAKPIEPRSQRLLQSRWDHVDAALPA